MYGGYLFKLFCTCIAELFRVIIVIWVCTVCCILDCDIVRMCISYWEHTLRSFGDIQDSVNWVYILVFFGLYTVHYFLAVYHYLMSSLHCYLGCMWLFVSD